MVRLGSSCCLMALFCLGFVRAAPNDSNSQSEDITAAGRCFLRRGRSSDSFSVSELLESGEPIGTLDVGGDAGPDGDIVLSIIRVKPNSHLVDIVPETKTLVLKGKLDKEGVDGPSSLQVNVKCEKKNSGDPAITIPTRIVIQDANDNVPYFVNTPYVLQLSEAMTPGMLITPNVVKAFDRDQPGPFSTVEYGIEPGPHSHLLTFQSAMSSTLVLKSSLDYETLPHFSVTVVIRDLGQPPLVNSTTLKVHVVDADDQNPEFSNPAYTAVLPESNSRGDVLKISPAPIQAEDQDRGLNVSIRYTFDTETMDGKYFTVDSVTGIVTLASAVPTDGVLPLTLVIRASQVDNEDRRALATLTVARSWLTTGLRFLSPLYHLNAPENLPVDSILLRLQTNRPYDQDLLFSLEEDFDGQFAVANSGQLVLKRPLDYEAAERLVLKIEVSSGRMMDVTRIELTVLNVNEHDPKFDSAAYSFEALASDVEGGHPIGRIIARDDDRHDRVTLTITGSNSNAFFMDDDGGVHLRNVSLLNRTTAVAHLVLVATDDGQPPRSSSTALEVVVASELLATAGEPFPLSTTHVIVVVFGVALGVFFFIIVVLAVHIAKKRHKRERVGLAPTSLYSTHRPLNKMSGYMTGANGHLYSPHQKLVSGSTGGLSPTNGSSPASSDSDNTHKCLPSTAIATQCATAIVGRHGHSRALANPVFDGDHGAVSRHRPNEARGQSALHRHHYHRHSHDHHHRHHHENHNNHVSIGRLESGASSTDDTMSDKCSDGDEDDGDPRVVCSCHGQPIDVDEENDVSDDGIIEDIRTRPECEQHPRCHRTNSLSTRRSSMKARCRNDGDTLVVAEDDSRDCTDRRPVPRRVKKLSWEDEKVQQTASTMTPSTSSTTAPNVDPSSIVVATYSSKLRPKSLENPDMTVYF